MKDKQLLINFLENEIKKLEKKISNIQERMGYEENQKKFCKLDTKRSELNCVKDRLQTLLVFAEKNFTVYCPSCNKYYEFWAGSLHLRKESEK